MTALWECTGMYGQHWTEGVLTEHLYKTEAAGFALDVDDVGNQIVCDGTDAFPVVCSELVWIDTEDGRIDGRCGKPVRAGAFACDGHAYICEGTDLEFEEKYG